MHRGSLIATELRRVARCVQRPRTALHKLLRHRGAVDRVEYRLPHLFLGHGIVGTRAASAIHAQILDSHRFRAHRLQIRHVTDCTELVGIELPDPVGAATQQFRHLGGGIRHFMDHDLADCWLALWTVRVIAIVTLQIDLGSAVDPGDLVRARADRVLGVFVRADLLAIRLWHDVECHRHVIERRRKHPLQFDAHMRIINFGGMIDERVIPGVDTCLSLRIVLMV